MGIPRRGERLSEAIPDAEFGFPGTDLRRRLVAAILHREKTSTSGLLSDYEREGEPLPEVGERFRLIDEQDHPVGVIETKEVWVTTIGEVDLPFALEEGEGFESVAEWRQEHVDFWLSYADVTRAWLKGPDWEPDDATPIVCERFRLVGTAASSELTTVNTSTCSVRAAPLLVPSAAVRC